VKTPQKYGKKGRKIGVFGKIFGPLSTAASWEVQFFVTTGSTALKKIGVKIGVFFHFCGMDCSIQ